MRDAPDSDDLAALLAVPARDDAEAVEAAARPVPETSGEGQAIRRAGEDRVLVADVRASARNWEFPEWAAEALLARTPPGWRVRIVHAPTVSDGDGGARPSDEVLTAIRDAEAYFGFGISRPLFLAAQRLRWMHSAAAGVGSLLFPEMLASDVIITNSAGIHGVPIAEYIVGGVLHFLRGFDVAIALQREGVWDKAPFVEDPRTMRELGECTALIIGAGGIGGETARRLSALGAKCVGVRRRLELGAPPGFERVVSPDEIDDELPRADIVVVAAPATARTQHLLDARRLALLPPRAIVVNVARGSLIDEEALAGALAAKRLRGAVLDVFAHEPLAPSSPLWQLRSCVVSPHISPVSPRRFWEREMVLFLDNWHRYVAGEPLRNVVDKQAGY